MANADQMKRLRFGAEHWNEWRQSCRDPVDLSSADLRRLNLKGFDLSGANLRRAHLSFAHLRHANLARADLGQAKLMGADLRGADLSNADLSQADLRGANLGQVALGSAKAHDERVNPKTEVVPNRSSALRSTSVSRFNGEAQDQSTPKSNSLQDNRLCNAGHMGATLTGANLQGACLAGAKLDGADFGGTNLAGVQWRLRPWVTPHPPRRRECAQIT